MLISKTILRQYKTLDFTQGRRVTVSTQMQHKETAPLQPSFWALCCLPSPSLPSLLASISKPQEATGPRMSKAALHTPSSFPSPQFLHGYLLSSRLKTYSHNPRPRATEFPTAATPGMRPAHSSHIKNGKWWKMKTPLRCFSSPGSPHYCSAHRHTSTSLR